MSAQPSTARNHRNLAALVFVNFLWAAQYPAYKVASDHMSVATLNFWSFFCSIALLLPFLLLERRRCAARGDSGSTAPPRVKVGGAMTTVLQFVALGVLGILPPSIMMSWGIARSTASNAAVLSLTIPLLMALLGVVLLSERMTRLRMLSLLLALSGTLLASRGDLSGDLVNLRMLIGNVVIIFAGLGSAFYNTYGKKLLLRFTEIEVLLYSYLVAFAGCALISACLDQKPLYQLSGYPSSAWLAVFVLGAFPWGIAMVLWMWVLKQLEASQVAVSIYLLSIFGVLLSALTLHERPSLAQIGGGLLVFVSTYLVSDYESRRAGRIAGAAEAHLTVPLSEQ